MIPAPFDYHAPQTLEEALALLQSHPDEAKVLSGGQSLLPLLKLRLGAAGHLVDIGRIPGLEYIKEEGGVLKIGGRIESLEAERELSLRYGENPHQTAAFYRVVGAPPVGLASISCVHWSDGGAIDLDRIVPALRRQGAALLIDATHAAGVLPLDVRRLDPDFLVFPTYKWVLGPYGRAFVYVAPRHQESVPLEQTAFGRRNVKAENPVYFADTRYLPDARRFDMGERDHFISMEMASIGMEMVADWGAAAIVQRLAMLTERIAQAVRGIGVRVPEPHLRAPHILSLAFKGGMPAGLVEGMASEGVYVAPRLGRMRVSPHVYNDEADADRFVEVLARRLRG